MSESFEFRMVPLHQLHESPWNTRKHFDDKKFEELLGSVQRVGVLTPLLARPNKDGFEIAAGHRRYNAAKKAGVKELPVRIREMTDAEFLKIVTIENLQREDLHPLDEALGYQALMKKAGYDVPAIAAKVGKSESYVYQRLKLADLEKGGSEAFLKDEITAGHAILIARLQPTDQAEALKRCFDVDGYGYMRRINNEGARTACSVRELGHWIQENIHLDLHSVPFNKTDLELVPAAGSCIACPKRTGFLPALFPDIAKKDTCTDRSCFETKLQAHITKKKAELEASGKVLQISTDYGHQRDTKDKSLLTANSYERVEGKKDHCASAEKAIVVEGHRDRGRVVEICRDPKCKKHGRERFSSGSSDRYAADQRRKEEKARNETTLRRRILDGILAVPHKEPSTEDLRLIALAFWERTLHDNQKVIAERRSWEIKTEKHQYGGSTRDFDGAGKKAIATAGAEGLVSLLLEFSLIADTAVNSFSSGTTGKTQLLETAKRYKVDVAGIEKQFAAEISEKKQKKAAREKKKTKAAKAGTKSAKGETKAAKPETNGAEPKSPHQHAGPKPRKGEHQCEVCKCTESYACEGGCWWDPEYLEKKRYVCNNCTTLAAQMDTGPRRRKSVHTSATETSA